MKETWLKKRILVEAGMLTVFLMLASGIAWAVSSYQDNLETERLQLQNQNGSLAAENQNVKNQIVKAKDSLTLYESIVRNNKTEDFSLNREAATKLLNQLKERYRISNMSVNMSPVRDLTEETFKRKTGTVILSEVTITFSGVTDELLYSFVAAVGQRFAGYVNVTGMRMSKTGDITNETLMDLSRGKTPSLVSGEMSFGWLGLKQNKEETPAQSQATPGTQTASAP